MLTGYFLPAVVAVTTAFAILWWPARTAGVLLLYAPIIWAGGAADMSLHSAGGLSIPVVVCGVATLMYARFFVRRQTTLTLERLRRATFVYCLGTLPAVFMGPSVVASLGVYMRLVSPVIFMFAFLHISRPRGLRSFEFKALALAPVSLLVVVATAHWAGEDSFFMGGFDRLRAFHLSPHNIALFCVAGSAVLVCGVLLGKRRLLYAAGIVPLMLCTYLTGYRTAWIGMAVLLAGILILAVRSRLAKFAGLLVFVVVLANGAVTQALARYAEPNEHAFAAGTLNAITSGRIMTDSVALDRYLAGSPAELLFGIGAGSAEQVTLRTLGAPLPVHSDILETLIECGIVGLASYLFLLLTIGWTLLRYRRYLHQQRTTQTLLAVCSALFAAFMVMGIPGALYTNVFVGWYYYGFIGFVLAHLQGALLAPVQVLSRRHAMGMPASAAWANRVSGGL